jgi:hypothetical protein
MSSLGERWRGYPRESKEPECRGGIPAERMSSLLELADRVPDVHAYNKGG